MSKSKKSNELKDSYQAYGNGFLDKFFAGKELYILISLILILCIIIFFDYISVQKILLFKGLGSDSINQFYSDYIHNSDYLRDNGIPFWSFYQGMGQNIFPGGITNPFNDILYIFGRDNIPYLLVYVEIIKILLTGVIIYGYFRTMAMSRFSSLMGGLLYAFSGYIILAGSGWYDHSASVVYGTFLLFSFEQYYKKKNWYYLPIAVFFIASNNPFYLFTFGVFVGIYGLFRFIDDNGFKWSEAGIFFVKCTGFSLIGLALSSVFLLNRFMIMIDSPRGSGVSSYTNQLKSISPFFTETSYYYISMIFRFFSNDILGTSNSYKGWYNYLEAPIFYSGLISLLLVPQLLFRKEDKNKKIVQIVFVSIWIIMIIFPYFRYAYFLFTGNYFKGGLDFVIPSILIFFSVYSFDYILKTGGVRVITLISTLLILLIFLNFVKVPNLDIVDDDLKLLSTIFLILYSVFLLMFKFKSAGQIAKYALIFIICIESGYFSYITYNKRIVKNAKELNIKYGLLDFSNDAVKYLNNRDNSFFRLVKDYTSGSSENASLNDAKVQKYYGLTSYSSFNQLYFIRFQGETECMDIKNEEQTRWASSLMINDMLFYICNVKYYLSKQNVNGLAAFKYQKINQIADIKIYYNPNYLPLGLTYDNYMSLSELRKLSKINKQLSFFKYCTVEDNDIKDMSSLTGFTGSDTVLFKKGLKIDDLFMIMNNLKQDTLSNVVHNQNQINGEIDLKQKKMLYLSIPYDKGWTAYVDGAKTKTYICNTGFTGLILEPGHHKIELKFLPQYFTLSLIVSIISLLSYSGLIFRSMSRKKKEESKNRLII